MIKIDCPDCGFNEYCAIRVSDSKKIRLVVGLCEDGSGELDFCEIEDGHEESTKWPSEEELNSYCNLKYRDMTLTDENCV